MKSLQISDMDLKGKDGPAKFHEEKANSDVHTDDAEQGDSMFKDDRVRKMRHNSSLNNVDEREEDEIECIKENCDDRSENLAEDVEDGVLEKPISVGIHGKTGRKRQLLDSEEGTLRSHLDHFQDINHRHLPVAYSKPVGRSQLVKTSQ